MYYLPQVQFASVPTPVQEPTKPRHFLAGNSQCGYSGMKDNKEDALAWLSKQAERYPQYSPFFLYEAVFELKQEKLPMKTTVLSGYKTPVVKKNEEDDDEDF